MDLVSGALLGIIGAAIWLPGFRFAWLWGDRLLGPRSTSEQHPRTGDVPPRTAARNLLSAVSVGVMSGAICLGLTLPFKSIVTVWRDFVLAWIIAFMLVLLLDSFRRRRDAA